MTIKSVTFSKINQKLHLQLKAESALKNKKIYNCYNKLMSWFEITVVYENLKIDPDKIIHEKTTVVRINNIDEQIYMNFKLMCVKQNITISEGINAAISLWLL